MCVVYPMPGPSELLNDVLVCYVWLYWAYAMPGAVICVVLSSADE